MRSTFALSAAASLLAGQAHAALSIDATKADTVKDSAKIIAKDLMAYYKGNTDSSQLGLLPKPPYYWWESGAMFGTMVGYSYLTGDHQYDGDVAKAIFSQISPTKNFMMMNQADNLGNDDIGFWGLTAMSAAEHNLPAPDGADKDVWVTTAAATFDSLIGRWNTTFCGGGIKWQFLLQNNGFNYKSTIANAATMQLGARLALLTGNQTYADKATMVWDWMKSVGYISDSYQVFDGAGDDPDNCTKIDLHEWSYNSANLLGAAAALAKYSAGSGKSDQASVWTDRVKGLWQHASGNFFNNGVLYEQACEDVGTCNVDQKSFKAYLARWATFASQIVPDISSDVQSKLSSTAAALVKSCTGDGGNACGMKWYDNTYSGETGVGEQMAALEVVIGLLAPSTPFVAGGASSPAASSSSASAPSSTPAPSNQSSPTTLQTSVMPSATGAAPSGSPPAKAAAASPDASSSNSGAQPTPAPAAQAPCLQNDHGVPYMTAAVAWAH